MGQSAGARYQTLEQVLDGLYDLAIGGTAVGTGLNAHPEFAERAARKLQELTGSSLPLHTPTSSPTRFGAPTRSSLHKARWKRWLRRS